MPVSYDSSDTTPAIYVIHENAEWTAPLYHALDELGLVYYDWNLATVSLNLSAAALLGL